MPIATVNPATGQTLETFTPLDGAGVEQCLARAAAAYADYRGTSFQQRRSLLEAAADLLETERADTARTVTLEMGKPLAQAVAEVDKCVKAMRWFAGHAAGLLADERVDPADVSDAGAQAAVVRYRPLGPVLAVMPWNFPLWQVIRFAAPALMAGNTALLKHASNVPRTALLLERLFVRAGYPQGCF